MVNNISFALIADRGLSGRTDMQELEKVLEEIEQRKARAEKLIVKPPHDKLDQVANDTAEAFIEAYKECQDVIRKHMNDGWIPVEEKPTEDGFYIATISGALVDQEEPFAGLAEFEDGEWVDGDDVIAWQSLPDPYRPERSR